MQARQIELDINGRRHRVYLPPNVTLLDALRDLGYTDVKDGCEKGDCGACAVLIDGRAVNSCLTLAWQADGAEIVTAAGLGTAQRPHPLQEAFADTGAIQCGYCTPGLLISAAALLDRNPCPGEAEIREALSGNLCRCTGYGQVVQAVQAAAERMRGDGETRARGDAESRRHGEGERRGYGDPGALRRAGEEGQQDGAGGAGAEGGAQ